MAQGLEASHLETTCCVCTAADVPREARRKVSEALALTVLGRKLNEISQISLKTPSNAIIIVFSSVAVIKLRKWRGWRQRWLIQGAELYSSSISGSALAA